MKATGKRGGQVLMVGYVLVLLMVLVLAFRTEQTIAAVLGGGQPPRVEARQESAGARLLAEIERRYEQIAQALPGLRDPFRDPPAPQRPAQPAVVARQVQPAEPEEPQGPVFPSVRAIIYDERNPSVRLVMGEDVSSWLRQGDIFRGWMVTQITPQSVRVTRDGSSYQIKAY
jgi:hypothetical protein